MNLYKNLKSTLDIYREKLNGKQLPKPRKSGQLQKKSLVKMESNLSQFLKELESKVDITDPNDSKDKEITQEKQKTKNIKVSQNANNRKSKVNNLKSDFEKEAIKGATKKKNSFNIKIKEENEVIHNIINQNYSTLSDLCDALSNNNIDQLKKINLKNIESLTKEGFSILNSIIYPKHGFDDKSCQLKLKVLNDKLKSDTDKKIIFKDNTEAHKALEYYFNEHYQYIDVNENITLFSNLFSEPAKVQDFIKFYLDNILFKKSNSTYEQVSGSEPTSQSKKIENKEITENIEIIENIGNIENTETLNKIDIKDNIINTDYIEILERTVNINKKENTENLENIENNIPLKKTENSGGLINMNFEEITLHEQLQNLNTNNDSLLAMNKIKNNFSNIKRAATKEEFRNSLVLNLNTKKLIESSKYKEEIEIENENIIYKINKTTNERELNFISMNLLLKYIINKTVDEKVNTSTTSINLIDLSKDFIIQHNGIISSTNLLELIKSCLNYYHVMAKNNNNSAIPIELIYLLNNFLIYNFKEEIFSVINIKQKLIQLYEIIEIGQPEIFFTNNSKNKIQINFIKEILKLDDLNETLSQINNLAESNNTINYNLNYNIEPPFMPLVNKEYFDILDWSEIELAKQLTLVTFHFFSNIKVKELLNSQWTKTDKHIKSKNVTKMIERFNNLCLWVCEEILSYDKGKYRALAIEKFIKLATELKNLNNFNDCFIIITALNSFQIKSLSKSWRRISFEGVKTIKELNNTYSYSRNFAALRLEIENCKGSCIPYLGLFLKELAFIDEGPKYFNYISLVNIEKIKKVAKVYDSIQKFQIIAYPFKPVFNLGFLADVTPITEQELVELSSKLEPKFTLHPKKYNFKRLNSTDYKSKNLSSNFNEFIQGLNKNKNSENLRERIQMHFRNIK